MKRWHTHSRMDLYAQKCQRDRQEDPFRGHRMAAHPSDCLIEAWAPDLASCIAEALDGLGEAVAEVGEVGADSPRETLKIQAGPGDPEEQLVSIMEEVISTMDLLSVVPTGFQLSETNDGGIAGSMEVVPVGQTTLTGATPKGVSYHGLSMMRGERGWHCRVLVDL